MVSFSSNIFVSITPIVIQAYQLWKITDDMLSPYYQQLKEDVCLKEPSFDKLISNLHKKTRNVLQEFEIVPDLDRELTKVLILALQP